MPRLNAPRLWIVALALALALAAPRAHAEPPDSASLARALDACVAPLVGSGELSGQLVVALGPEVLLERAWGWADRRSRAPMTPTSRLNIASITKPVNQVLLIQLLGEKKLALSDTIGRWLPGFPHGRITVAQLLEHSSGIPHRVTTDEQERRVLTAAEVTELAGRTPLEFEPGQRSSYSSAGYTVLAHVMELATGESWAELVRKRVIEPARLVHTVPSAGLADALPERSRSYMPGPAGPTEPTPKDLGFLAGAGSMWSTALDLEQLARALADGMLGATVKANLMRGGRLSWSGNGYGFFSYLDYDTTSHVCIVFLGNLHDGAPELLHAALPRLLAGEVVAPLEPPHVTRARVPAARLRRLEGRYDVAGNHLTITERSGVLWADDWMLVPTSDSTFFSPVDYGTVDVAHDSTGALAGLDWIQGGRPYRCPRVGPLAEGSPRAR
jgi:D-alanyl-D-alanine carboxypeptidase